jgi:branched-chain amino acid transport system substrate-binding protein
MAKNLSTPLWSSHRRTLQTLAFLICAFAGQAFAQAPADPEKPPVWIGFDDAFGIKTPVAVIWYR